MRRRFSRTPFRRGFRRKSRVAWATNSQLNSGCDGVQLDHTGAVTYHLLQEQDNDFVQAHPRFAKANDVVTLRRILGRLRIALYATADNIVDFPAALNDYVIDYGLIIVKGDYDPAGVWTQKDEPSPEEPADEDDKWLFKNEVVLNLGSTHFNTWVDTNENLTVTTGGNADLRFIGMNYRQGMPSNDMQLPNGSYIDLKTRRRLEYGERLALVAKVCTDNTEFGGVEIIANWQLRLLMSKWS